MSTNCNLLLDALNVLPEEVECFIQAPSLENEVVQKMMTDSDFDYYKVVKLNNKSKKKFIDQVLAYSIADYFQNIQIKYNSKLLFEGFDGVEFGTLSKSIIIPEWFKEKYILTGLCTVSDEW